MKQYVVKTIVRSETKIVRHVDQWTGNTLVQVSGNGKQVVKASKFTKEEGKDQQMLDECYENIKRVVREWIGRQRLDCIG